MKPKFVIAVRNDLTPKVLKSIIVPLLEAVQKDSQDGIYTFLVSFVPPQVLQAYAMSVTTSKPRKNAVKGGN